MRTHHLLAVAACVMLLLLTAFLQFGAPGSRPAPQGESGPQAPADIQFERPRPQHDAQPAATQAPAVASDNAATPDPVDGPSAPTQQPANDTPQQAPRDFLAASQAHILDWKLTSADYQRIMESPDATENERKEARYRHLSGFADWPGRDVPRLGGFKFNPGDYRLLTGLELHDLIGVRVHMLGDPPIVYLERKLSLFTPSVCVWVHIRVFRSREWAQYWLHKDLPSVIDGVALRPVKPSVDVGDVCVISPEQTGGPSKVRFVRHNVFIELDLTRDRNGFAANMLTLASEIDEAIKAQSHRAQTWEELAPHRPVIEIFRPDVPAIRGVLPRPGVPQPELDMPAEAALDIRVKGDGIKLHCRPDHAARKSGAFRVYLEEAPKTVYTAWALTETATFDIWLVAYDDSLLFSTAAAAITVHPPSAPK